MSHIDCSEALARLYDYLDGELSPDDAEAVRQHLQNCGACHPLLRFCSRFQDALRRAGRRQTAAPPSLHARIAEALRDQPRDH